MNEKIDTINIELVVHAVQADKDDIWMQGDLEISINGKKPYSDDDIINVNVFFESLKSDGNYFIFSCNCGQPECGGWYKGIKVLHQEKTVKWIDLDKNKSWCLAKDEIEKDLEIVREELENYKQYFLDKNIRYVGVGYNW